jgi:hypothetical protein
VIKSNGKKRARLEAMRHVLRLFEYPGKAVDVATDPDPKVFGPAAAHRPLAVPRRARYGRSLPDGGHEVGSG